MSDDMKLCVPNRRALRTGEWACVDAKCAHINSEKRTSCECCGKGKPRAKNRIGREIGKDAAEKSKGLFSADDWVCTKCGNVNWARRSVCNICNAPKLGDVEVRTGYGGGYMDREDVEYIEREDNEEFDEFGRKKKKRKPEHNDKVIPDGDNRTVESIAKLDEDEKITREIDDYFQNDTEGEDEEEEEEDSDVDLDKYDLTADPDLLSFKVDPQKLRSNSVIDEPDRPGSAMSSDCSCSCSGGECSCVESEDEVQSKKSKTDRTEERRRSPERSKNRSNVSHKEKDRRNGDRKPREDESERERSRSSRERSHEKSRGKPDRERHRSRERDYHRSHR